MSANDPSCAHCKAAHGGGECHAHWGLEAAVDYFRDIVIDEMTGNDPTAKQSFIEASRLLQSFKPTRGRARISTTIRAEQKEGVIELHVEAKSI